jgi:hypothetical protein
MPQQVLLSVGDKGWIPRIWQKESKGLNETEPAIDLAQEHHAAITRDITAPETGFDFTPIEA